MSTSEFDIKKVQKFANLEDEKKELKDKLNEVKGKLDKLEEQLTKQFEKAGVPNIGVGGRTVYVHRQLWAGYKQDKPKAIEALKDSSLNNYIYETYNTHSLSAYFRERVRELEEEKEGEPIEPEEALEQFPELKDHIKLTEKVSLRSRKS